MVLNHLDSCCFLRGCHAFWFVFKLSGIFKDVIGDKIIAFALKNVLVSTNVQSIINPAFRTLFCMGMTRL